MLALNNTWLPSNNTVVTLRYGMTEFIDNDTLSIDFDPSTLGFRRPSSTRSRCRSSRSRVTDYDSATTPG